MKQPKPFFRRFTQSWYVQIGNQQINLGRDRKLAWEKYHQLMAKLTSLPPFVSRLLNVTRDRDKSLP